MQLSQLVCIIQPFSQYNVIAVRNIVQFYIEPVTSRSDVHHLTWEEGLNYITAVTKDSVS